MPEGIPYRCVRIHIIYICCVRKFQILNSFVDLHLFSTFRLLYLQPCVRNSSGARCGFGLIHLLTAWRHKCRVHYVVSELIFNEIDCILNEIDCVVLQIWFNSLPNTEGTPLRVGISCLSPFLVVQFFFCRNGICIKRLHSMEIGGGCQLQDVVYRGSSAIYHFEVCPAHPWLTGRCQATKTINDFCDR